MEHTIVFSLLFNVLLTSAAEVADVFARVFVCLLACRVAMNQWKDYTFRITESTSTTDLPLEFI